MACIGKIKKLVNFFKNVPCTIKGKVLIANTIFASKVLLALVKRLVYSFGLVW